MYKKILVPMALTHNISPQMLQVAKALCDADGEIIALHVYETPQASVSAYLEESDVKAAFEKARALLIDKLKDSPDVTPKILKGHSARTIIDFAENNGIDCIVMGSHKPGLSDYFLGSTASRVVRHAPCAVHVNRETG